MEKEFPIGVDEFENELEATAVELADTFSTDKDSPKDETGVSVVGSGDAVPTDAEDMEEGLGASVAKITEVELPERPSVIPVPDVLLFAALTISAA